MIVFITSGWWGDIETPSPVAELAARLEARGHEIRRGGFDIDGLSDESRELEALQDADAIVVHLPGLLSASVALGWAGGAGLPIVVLLNPEIQPAPIVALLADRIVGDVAGAEAAVLEQLGGAEPGAA